MRRRARLAAVLAPLLLLAPAPSAADAGYRGAGTDDPQMTVKVSVVGRDVTFTYAHVLVNCTDGSQVRQGGAVHTARLNSENRFKDTLEVEGEEDSNVDWTTSVVQGKISVKKASGSVTYDLEYDGGECHSGPVKWSAKRR